MLSMSFPLAPAPWLLVRWLIFFPAMDVDMIQQRSHVERRGTCYPVIKYFSKRSPQLFKLHDVRQVQSGAQPFQVGFSSAATLRSTKDEGDFFG